MPGNTRNNNRLVTLLVTCSASLRQHERVGAVAELRRSPPNRDWISPRYRQTLPPTHK